MSTILESGKILIRLDESIRVNPVLPLGYPPAIVQMLSDLVVRCGLDRLELFWPLGISISAGLQRPSGFLRPNVSLVNLLTKIRESERRWNPPPGGWSPVLEAAARLRLLATVAPGREAEAVHVASSAPGVRFAEPIALRHGPCLEDNSNPGAKVVFNPTAVNRWAKEALAPLSVWDKYQLNNIAVLDSGCDLNHPSFSGRVVTPDSYSSDYTRSDHATFICGQLVGAPAAQPSHVSNRADLPAGYGLLPKSKLWLMSVEKSSGTSKTFLVHNGVYSFALWLLAKGDAPTRAHFQLTQFSIKVLNLSLGSSESLYEYEAIGDRTSWPSTYAAHNIDTPKDEAELVLALEAAGITVVACSHNILYPGAGTNVWFPAAYPTVLSVAAVDADMKLYAKARTTVPDGTSKNPAVDLCAPGVDIYSSSPVGSTEPFIRSWSGTSFAAPCVTAAAAVLHKLNPQLTPPNVREALKSIHRRTDAVVPVPTKSAGSVNIGILKCTSIKSNPNVIGRGEAGDLTRGPAIDTGLSKDFGN